VGALLHSVTVTLRIMWFFESAMYTSPAASTHILRGSSSLWATAGDPLPSNPFDPVPATVVMIFVWVSILRSTEASRSSTYRALSLFPPTVSP